MPQGNRKQKKATKGTNNPIRREDESQYET